MSDTFFTKISGKFFRVHTNFSRKFSGNFSLNVESCPVFSEKYFFLKIFRKKIFFFSWHFSPKICTQNFPGKYPFWSCFTLARRSGFSRKFREKFSVCTQISPEIFPENFAKMSNLVRCFLKNIFFWKFFGKKYFFSRDIFRRKFAPKIFPENIHFDPVLHLRAGQIFRENSGKFFACTTKIWSKFSRKFRAKCQRTSVNICARQVSVNHHLSENCRQSTKFLENFSRKFSAVDKISGKSDPLDPLKIPRIFPCFGRFYPKKPSHFSPNFSPNFGPRQKFPGSTSQKFLGNFWVKNVGPNWGPTYRQSGEMNTCTEVDFWADFRDFFQDFSRISGNFQKFSKIVRNFRKFREKCLAFSEKNRCIPTEIHEISGICLGQIFGTFSRKSGNFPEIFQKFSRFFWGGKATIFRKCKFHENFPEKSVNFVPGKSRDFLISDEV